MELPDALLDAPVPEEPFPLPDLHQVDAIPQAPHASDASAVVRPDEAADAALPALADAPYAEKWADPVPDALVRSAEALPLRRLPPDA